jgi:hypothetical protein
MDSARFERLLRGDLPSSSDFIGFVRAIENLPGELLWVIVNQTPNLNRILRKVLMSTLQNKVVRENLDNLRFGS